MKSYLLILLLFPLIVVGQNNTVIEPKINAQTLNGIPYPSTIGSTGDVITPVGGELVWLANPAFVGVVKIDAANISQVALERAADTIYESFGHDHVEYKLATETITIVDVSNPPTDAELDAAFPSPSRGFSVHIDDNNLNTNYYYVVWNGTSWWIFTGTKAL